jgi:ABC-type multidrug transport system fused ATPase/permease subunit
LTALSARVGQVAGQARRYVAVFGWLLKDSMRSEPRHWRIIVVATIVSLAANVGAVGVIYWYVRLLESDASTEILGMSLVARDSSELLFVTVVGLVSLLLLYATSQYIARSRAIRASRLFEERCSRKALAVSGGLPDPRAHRAEEVLADSKLIHLVTMYARYCGMAVRLLANGIGALLVFLASLAVLFWLDLGMTLVVVAVGVAIVAAQYPAVKAAAGAGKRWADTRKTVNRRVSQLLRRLNTIPRHSLLAEPDPATGRLFESLEVRQNLDAWEGRLRSIDRSTLTMQIGGGLLLGGLILFIGLSFIQGEQDWAALLVYVTMLRLLLANLTSVFRALTGVSRFYPQIQSYRDFTRSATLACVASTLDPEAAAEPFLEIDAVDAAGLARRLLLRRGQIYAIMAPPGYGKDLLAYIARSAQAALDGSAKKLTWTMDLVTEPPSAELLAVRHSPGDDDALGGWLSEQRFRATASRGLASIEASGIGLVVIDRLIIDTMENEEWQRWKRRLATRIVLIAYQEAYATLADQGEEMVLVPDGLGGLSCFETSGTGFETADWDRLRAVQARAAARSSSLDDFDDTIE